MKIGIDVSQVVYGSGVSAYTKNLVSGLIKLDKKNQYLLFGGVWRQWSQLHRFIGQCQKDNPRVRGRIVPLPPIIADKLFNRYHQLPLDFFTGKLRIFHSSDWTQPKTKSKKVTTIHDLSFLRWPQSVDPLVLAVQKRRLDWVKEECNHIIAVSNATKGEIIDLLDYPSKSITVIPEALPEDIFTIPLMADLDLLNRLGITRPYMIAFGSSSVRKNITRITAAFSAFNQQHDYQLVVCGDTSEKTVSKDIVYTGFLPRPAILNLFSRAHLLIYPSLYEGFGLPVLEAFALRVPVVTSNCSSLPEVAGQAAVLVDPQSIDNIAAGIGQDNKNRAKLIEAGNVQLQQFSWSNTAAQTLSVYEKLA